MQERIQLHLFDYQRFQDEYEAPLEVTQEGIARAVGISIHHVTQYVRPLLAEELVEEKTSHIRRGRRRRKAYFLTTRGRHQAASLRGALLKREVPFRSRHGETVEVPLTRIYQEHRRGTSLVELLLELKSVGYISDVVGEEEPGIVDFAREAPRVDLFYGREEEVSWALEAVERAPFVAITGMAGIGKTTLGSKVCEALRGRRSLFWRQVRPWDGAMDLALRLAAFLSSMGRVGLQSALLSSGPKELSRIEELLREDLAGIKSLLVFDDVHDASPEAISLLAILLRILNQKEGTSVLLLSRTVPSFYSRRDVDLEGTVAELPLKGLKAEGSRSILEEAGVAEPLLGPLIKAAGGNPLFLRLLSKTSAPGAPKERTVEVYIAEEIEPGLSRPERRCLEVASFYQIPVSSSGLLLERGVRGSTLVGLRKKGLLDDIDPDRLALHDTLRGYFVKGVSRERAEEIAAKVVPWLRSTALDLAERGSPEEGIGYVQNAVAVEADPARLVSSLELLAGLRRFVGDYPGAVEAYRTALRTSRDRKVQARLRGKIASCQVNQGNLEEADREIDAGLALVPPEPSLEAAWLHYQRAAVCYSRQDYDRCLEIVEQVLGQLPLLPEAPDLYGFLVNVRALVYIDDPRRADYALAQADLTEALSAFTEAGNRRGLTNVYNNLGLTALELDRNAEAFAYLDHAEAVAEEAGDYAAQAVPLLTKAFALMNVVGDYDAAEATYQKSYKLARETHQRNKMVWHYWHFAELYRRQERFEEARESLEFFLQASGDMTNRETRAQYLGLMVRLCALSGDIPAAEAYFKEAWSLVEGVHSEQAEHALIWARGMLLAHQGDTKGAEASYQKALELADPDERGEFLLDYGRFLASVGERDRAKDLLLSVARDFSKASTPLERSAREALQALDARGGP